MKTTSLLLLGAVAFGIYEVAQLGTFSNDFQLIFSGVQVQGPLNYALTFTIQNVTNATVKLNSLAADVSVNGDSLGNISTFNEVDIMPNSQQNITLNLRPSITSIPGAILDFINNKPGELDFRVLGNMNVNTFVLPVDVQNTIKI